MNLMLNAIEAMKDTAGELTIKTEMGQGGLALIFGQRHGWPAQ